MLLATLPAAVSSLLQQLSAPPRLVAHLRLVHDTAAVLLDGIAHGFPGVPVDSQAVLFGAATHDIGKCLHPAELSSPGAQHEEAGYQLLLSHGYPAGLARFARNHGSWSNPDSQLEDLLVALADKVWKGKRVQSLEQMVTAQLALLTERESWDVYMTLDDILTGIAADAEARLAYQSQHRLA